MAKADEERRRKLAALDTAVADGRGAEGVLTAMGEQNYLVVSKAARIALRERYTETCQAMAEAYPWFCEGTPAKRDPGCRAKTSLIKALYEMDYLDTDFYRTNLHYIQMEPVMGGHEDSAQEVRSTAAAGLAHCNPPGVILELVETLTDNAAAVRVGAVSAIGSLGSQAAEAVIRFKALDGDSSPEVIGQCATEILTLNPDDGPDFVASLFTERQDAVTLELIALALGESRLPRAIELLIEKWDGPRISLRTAIIQALAVAHTEAAFDFLYAVIEKEMASLAKAALVALSVYRYDDGIRAAVEGCLRAREGSDLDRAFREAWEEE